MKLMDKLKNKELTSTQITQSYIDRIEEKEDEVKAFVTILKEEALTKRELYTICMLQMLSH